MVIVLLLVVFVLLPVALWMVLYTKMSTSGYIDRVLVQVHA